MLRFRVGGMKSAVSCSRWGVNLQRVVDMEWDGGGFQSGGRSSPHKWKTWEVVQGLIKSSDCARWEQLSSSLSPNIGNQILLLTFSIKGRLLHGQNDQACLRTLQHKMSLKIVVWAHSGWENLVYKISADVKSKNRFPYRGERRMSDAIHALYSLHEFGGIGSECDPNHRNSLASLWVWRKLSCDAFLSRPSDHSSSS